MISKKTIPLSTTLYALIVMASILPAFFLIPWLTGQATSILLDAEMTKEEAFHNQVSNTTELEIKRLTSVLVNKADSIADYMLEAKENKIHQVLNNIAEKYPFFNTMSVYDKNVQNIVSKHYRGHQAPKITSQSPDFVIAMRGRVFHGAPTKLDDQHYEITIAVPLKLNNKVHGVLISTINIDELWDSLIASLPEHNSIIYLVDSRGTLLEKPETSHFEKGSLLTHHEVVRSILAGHRWRSEQVHKGIDDEAVFTIASVSKGVLQWGLISEIPEDIVMKTIQPMLKVLILIIITLHITFAIIGVVLTRLLIQPISDLTNIMKKAKSGDYSYKVKEYPYMEINTLATSYQVMIDEIQAREGTLTKLHHAINHAGDAILITDPDGIIEYVNHSFCEQSGYNEEETIGMKPGILSSNSQNEDFYATLWRSLTTGDSWQGKIVNRKKDGTLYPVYLNISPVFINDKISHFIAIMQDTSEHQKLENQLRQAQKMESIGTLVGGIAHDFNNLLAGIIGSLYLIKKNFMNPSRNDDTQSKIERAESLCEQAATMISHLLTFARKGVIDVKKIAINAFLKDTVEFARLMIPENIKFTHYIASRPMFINGDTTQLQQIILNLLNNARDALSSAEDPKIKLQLKYFTPDAAFLEQHPEFIDKGYAQISVTDNGHGISPENVAVIFEPFFTTKDIGKGTGLGLAMVYGAIKSLSGYIYVESTIGKGTSFHIYLPVVRESELGPIHQESRAKELPNLNKTILIVDDEEHILETTGEVLTSLGYTIYTAKDGNEAITVFTENKETISIAVLDLVMPNSSGMDAAKAIRNINPKLPIIFVTGYDQRAVLKHNTLENTVALNKPVKPAVLNHTIHQLLNNV